MLLYHNHGGINYPIMHVQDYAKAHGLQPSAVERKHQRGYLPTVYRKGPSGRTLYVFAGAPWLDFRAQDLRPHRLAVRDCPGVHKLLLMQRLNAICCSA